MRGFLMWIAHIVEENIAKRQAGRVFSGICCWETATVLGIRG